jgi:hypothetical protein
MIAYLIIFVAFIWIWIISEWINAPSGDNTTNNDSSTKSNDTNNQEI